MKIPHVTITAMPAFVQFDNVHFAYRDAAGISYPAIRDISLTIEAGEFIAIVGANGSGKTTLARHINGLLLPDSGTVTVSGLDTRQASSLIKIRQIVGMVFQFPEDQIVATTVEDDIAFGLENHGFSLRQITRRVNAVLAEFGLQEHRQRPPHLLSAGQMQRVALAGVMAVSPQCLILDEPTAMLDPQGKRELLEQLRKLHRDGTTIILITHNMDETALAERIVVLHEGKIVQDGCPSKIFTPQNRLEKYGLELPTLSQINNMLAEVFPTIFQGIHSPSQVFAHLPLFKGSINQTSSSQKTRTRKIENLVKGVGIYHTYMPGTPFEHPALVDVSFTAGEGRVLGLLGATGSGKSTLLQHLNGLYRPQKGVLHVGPFDLANEKTDIRTVRQYVGLAFQIPENQFFNQYVGDEIAYAARQFGKTEKLAQKVRSVMQLVGLDFDTFKDRPLYALSGGERRKVALASILIVDPHLLVLDEPTAGLDPCARRELLGRMLAWKQRGRTIVVSSQSMEDIQVLADDLLLLQHGRVNVQGSSEEILSDSKLLNRCGLEQPLLAGVLQRLRDKGWSLPPNIRCVLQLKKALQTLVKA